MNILYYTIEEISKILSVCERRIKDAILLIVASTNMRVGALPSLKCMTF